MVQVLTAMVEAELAFLEVEVKRVRVHPAESREACLGVAPEAFDAVDVAASSGLAGELALAVIDTPVLLVPQVDQAVVTSPAVGVDHAATRDFASNRPLQHGFRAVRDDLGVDLARAFEDAEDRRLLPGAAAGLALDAAWPEVALVDFDGPGERAVEFARLGHALTKARQQAVDGVAVEAGEHGDLHGGQVGRDVPGEATELRLCNS